MFALIAGRRHVGPVDGGGRGALRRLTLSRSIAPQPGLHRLEDMLRLADVLGVPRVERLVCPGGVSVGDCASVATPDPDVGEQPYAVIHAAPMFQYKRWTAEGWRELAHPLRARGLKVGASGGPAAAERAYLDAVWGALPDVVRRDGQLSWPQLATLLARARLFVGPDTSVTLLA